MMVQQKDRCSFKILKNWNPTARLGLDLPEQSRYVAEPASLWSIKRLVVIMTRIEIQPEKNRTNLITPKDSLAYAPCTRNASTIQSPLVHGNGCTEAVRPAMTTVYGFVTLIRHWLHRQSWRTLPRWKPSAVNTQCVAKGAHIDNRGFPF